MLDLTTPALLFPAISLLLLAYTNRFLTLAGLLRQLGTQKIKLSPHNAKAQISNLRFRVLLIRWMQTLGVLSFLLCTASMISIYIEWHSFAHGVFLGSLVSLCGSLVFSLWEIHISMVAINLELASIEENQ
ncbi:MAG: DUF2721 domain-containing protein [Gammaproteobacteria bacterium]|nr:DUF2721 domain-containing protein [Gammaproteobacteria bacterium]